jgi:hypothetical protein
VLFSCFGKLIAPIKWLLHLFCFSLEILNSLFDRFRPFICAQIGFSLPLQDLSIKTLKHFLEVRDERLGVRPRVIKQIEDVFVDLGRHL